MYKETFFKWCVFDVYKENIQKTGIKPMWRTNR